MNTLENLSSQARAIDWQAIHESIQRIFASLADVVQAECLSIRSRGGKTQTTSQLLFSYRVFEVDAGRDPVVAGVDFAPTPSGAGIVVRADLCGEETGLYYFELPEQTVTAVQDVLRSTAESLAKELSEQGDRIIAALKQQKTVSSPVLDTHVNGMGIVRKEYESRS